MSDPEHAGMMLRMALKDLSAAERMADDRSFAEEVFGFHAQQAAEKALKAWLSWCGVAYPRTHDLSVLCGLVEDTGSELPEGCSEIVDLADFAVQFRYEAFDDLGETLDRPRIAVLVRRLVEHVGSLAEGNQES